MRGYFLSHSARPDEDPKERGGAPVQLLGLMAPVPAVLKLTGQAVQAGCGAVRLPPLDQVPLGHKVAHVDPDPVLPGWQIATVNGRGEGTGGNGAIKLSSIQQHRVKHMVSRES